MKICTDIDQSINLVKSNILSIENADMYYPNRTGRYGINYAVPIEIKLGMNLLSQEIPAFSIDVLANLLPIYLFEFDRGIDLSIYPNSNGKGWHVAYMPNNKVDLEKDSFRLISDGATLVDALYEMVLKLHELNLL